MSTKNTRQITFIATVMAIGLSLAGAAAHAEGQAPASAFVNRTVSYSDLNLASASGLDRLYHRVAAAAKQVCGSHENPRGVADKMRSEICIQQSIERAVATINHPGLTRLAALKSGRSAPPVVLADRQ